MNDAQTIQALTERLPSPGIVRLVLYGRERGMDWDDLADKASNAVQRTAEEERPMSRALAEEAERYVRRVFIAAYSIECEGMNN